MIVYLHMFSRFSIYVKLEYELLCFPIIIMIPFQLLTFLNPEAKEYAYYYL